LFCFRKITYTSENVKIIFWQKILKLKDSSKPNQFHQNVVKNCISLRIAQLLTLSKSPNKGDIIATLPFTAQTFPCSYISAIQKPLEINGTDADLPSFFQSITVFEEL